MNGSDEEYEDDYDDYDDDFADYEELEMSKTLEEFLIDNQYPQNYNPGTWFCFVTCQLGSYNLVRGASCFGYLEGELFEEMHLLFPFKYQGKYPDGYLKQANRYLDYLLSSESPYSSILPSIKVVWDDNKEFIKCIGTADMTLSTQLFANFMIAVRGTIENSRLINTWCALVDAGMDKTLAFWYHHVVCIQGDTMTRMTYHHNFFDYPSYSRLRDKTPNLDPKKILSKGFFYRPCNAIWKNKQGMNIADDIIYKFDTRKVKSRYDKSIVVAFNKNVFSKIISEVENVAVQT